MAHRDINEAKEAMRVAMKKGPARLGLIIAGIVVVNEAVRQISIQYAKRIIGRKMYGGQSTHLPIKINSAGVIPPIFASSILTFPNTILQFANVGILVMFANIINDTNPLYHDPKKLAKSIIGLYNRVKQK